MGKFLAFQYAIDINYSELCDFSEMDYVVAGPGAHSGISKIFWIPMVTLMNILFDLWQKTKKKNSNDSD